MLFDDDFRVRGQRKKEAENPGLSITLITDPVEPSEALSSAFEIQFNLKLAPIAAPVPP
jgi:hypothetical protein